jgi:hypothetical protein
MADVPVTVELNRGHFRSGTPEGHPMPSPLSLRLEALEDRSVPAIFGIPWADARHLTLSFVPDGTAVDGAASNLFAAMPGPAADWQVQVLRAVEAWAAVANINVAVVADSGDPLGAPGAVQGDSRFGDIRVAARPLSNNVLAITTPSGFLGGTRTGDIVLNSNDQFKPGGASGTVDLYTVMLQEAGHALGVSDGPDPASVMYEAYSGARSGLSAGDVASIQALYGTRTDDGFEPNSSFAKAQELTRPKGSSNASIVVLGDIATPQDVDYFKVRTANSNPYGLTFRLNAGISLLAPRMTVYDPNGTVVGSAQSVNPQTGALSVTLAQVPANALYTVKVEAANPAFGVGSYQLKVVFDPSAPDALTPSATAYDDGNTANTIATATRLATTAGYAPNTHYSILAIISDASDIDFYKIHAPNAGRNQQNVLTVNVRALDAAALAPVVKLYTKDQRPVSATILANGNGTYTIQLAGADSSQDYYLSVAAGNAGGTGDYQLDADFRSQVINLQQFGGGSLTAGASKDYSTLTAYRSQMMYFVLSAAADPAARAGVRMVIFDGAGHAVASLFAQAGQTVSLTTYLALGVYTVRYEGLTPTGSALPNLTYSLQGVTLTDPIGPTGSNPTLGSGSTAVSDYSWTKFLSDYYATLVLDPVAGVLW